MSGGPLVLVVEDRRSLREMLARTLCLEGFQVRTAAGVEEGRAALAGARAALVDLRLPDGTGLDLLEAARALSPPPPVVLMTAYGSVEVAVEAMRQGATDFLCKPFDTRTLVERLRALVGEAAEPGEGRPPEAEPETGLVAVSPAMREVVARARRAAAAEVPVLLSGESGTGKEVVARLIHEAGPRAEAPFVAVNCAALPGNLVESELFGHVKGAFTGAESDRPGLIREAEGGTLFLDEVAEMAPEAQSKLLRVLQDRQVTPVGGGRPVAVDVRFVAATNRDLGEALASGGLREDLFYRLAVVVLRLPPLRERREEILPLAERFLAEAGGGARLTQAAREALLAHPWPGNVRELKNCMERARLFCQGGEIGVADLELGAGV
ncbi:MAG: sigma-54-dependent Fis family transcriptional regulator, partial [Nitrospirae bacterium]